MILNKPLVYIVILNYNGRELLRRCLDSLLKRTIYENYRIIVVDNGSIDGSVAMIRDLYPYIELIALKKNMGYARANNYGIIRALRKGAKYVVLMNNEIEIIDPLWLYKAVVTMERHRDTGIVGVNLVNPDGTPQQYPTIKKPIEVKEVAFATVVIRAEVFKKIGFLDPGYVIGYSEDTDFCWRTRRAGFKIIYIPYIKIIHFCQKTFGRIPHIVYMVGSRNHVRFTILNYSVADFIKHYLLLSFITRKNGFSIREDAIRRLKWLTYGFIQLLYTNDIRQLIAMRIKRQCYGFKAPY
jgi:GT2 family glycosyltransferase